MPISKTRLVAEFGALVEARSAALFIGAGVFVGAGLPSWSDIATVLRDRADIPREVKDASVVAEYFAMEEGGHPALEATLLRLLTHNPSKSTPALRSLANIPVLEFWTTTTTRLSKITCPRKARWSSRMTRIMPANAVLEQTDE